MADLKQIAQNSEASQGALEMEWLLNKVSKIRPKVILEIGVHLGHSLKAWQDAFEPDHLVGIDNETNPTLEQYMEDGLLLATLIIADSHDPNTGWRLVEDILEGEWVDFLFIDGDHTLDGVTKDFEMYGPLVREGGIIAFHDAALINHPEVKVYELINRLKSLGRTIKSYQSDANGIAILYV